MFWLRVVLLLSWMCIFTTSLVYVILRPDNESYQSQNWTNVSYLLASIMALVAKRPPAALALASVAVISFLWHAGTDTRLGPVDSWGAHVAIVYLILSLAFPKNKSTMGLFSAFLVTVCQIPSRTGWNLEMEIPIIIATGIAIFAAFYYRRRYIWKDIIMSAVFFCTGAYFYLMDNIPVNHGFWHVAGGMAAGCLVTAFKGSPYHVLGIFKAKKKRKDREVKTSGVEYVTIKS